MCIHNTYTCPKCHNERKEIIPCAVQSRLTMHRNPSLGSLPRFVYGCQVSQKLLATCLTCVAQYQAALEEARRLPVATSLSRTESSGQSENRLEQLMAERREMATTEWHAHERKCEQQRYKRMAREEAMYKCTRGRGRYGGLFFWRGGSGRDGVRG